MRAAPAHNGEPGPGRGQGKRRKRTRFVAEELNHAHRNRTCADESQAHPHATGKESTSGRSTEIGHLIHIRWLVFHEITCQVSWLVAGRSVAAAGAEECVQ